MVEMGKGKKENGSLTGSGGFKSKLLLQSVHGEQWSVVLTKIITMAA